MKKSVFLLLCFWLATSMQVFAQGVKVQGKVIDASTNEPLPGVSVIILGTSSGTVTDVDGNYSISVSTEGAKLQYSFIGYEKQEVEVGNQTTINVSLKQDVKKLEEVVVVGYGVQKKSDVTGSVAKLTRDQFNKGNVLSPTELIQGNVSGVQVLRNGGEPGSAATIRIRGNTSVRSNNDPLYVVDGVPLGSDNPYSNDGGGISGVGNVTAKNPLNFINADDIESIDILKDASATAIYGSRGANGVVIITTKKGKQGKGSLSYSTYYGFSNLPKKLPIMSASEYRQAIVDYNLPKSLDKGDSVDYQDAIFRTAYSKNHNLSFTGGVGSTAVRASMGYTDEQGIIKGTGTTRFTGRINGTNKFINDKLTVDANLAVTQIEDQKQLLSESGTFEGNLLLNALKFNPTNPIFNDDGTYNQPSISNRNPIAMMAFTNNKIKTMKFMGSVNANLKIFESLDYSINLGTENSNSKSKFNQDARAIYLPGGRADINTMEISHQAIDQYLTYTNKFGNHDIKIMAGYSYEKNNKEGLYVSTTQFIDDPLVYTNNLAYGTVPFPPGSSLKNEELQSIFGRLNYKYNEKYLLTFTLRRDGCSKFGPGNKYATFPSVALAWRLSQEEFIKNLNLFHDLKLRFGWGQTGSQTSLSPGLSMAFVTASQTLGFYQNGKYNPGITFVQTPNPNLKWETNTQTNVGLDVVILKGKVSATIDYYKRVTSDPLMNISTVSPAPTDNGWTNVEKTNFINSGIELSMNVVLFDSKDFSWSVNGNVSFMKNDVQDLVVSRINYGAANGQGMTGVTVQGVENGYPVGEFYGPVFLGYDTTTGRSVYKLDTLGNRVMEHLGSPLPTMVYGFGTSVRYKGFDLGIMFNGVSGNKVFNNTANSIFNRGAARSGFNTTTDAINSKQAFNDALVYSSKFIEDGSYLRLSNATLGYTLNASKWTKNNISTIRLYVTGTNLLLFTDYKGYDPEVNGNSGSNGMPSIGVDFTSYPKARTILFGMNVEF